MDSGNDFDLMGVSRNRMFHPEVYSWVSHVFTDDLLSSHHSGSTSTVESHQKILLDFSKYKFHFLRCLEYRKRNNKMTESDILEQSSGLSNYARYV
jgi:hypothetical protein